MRISLPGELADFVDELVVRGEVESASEYVHSLIRRDKARRELRELVLEGMNSPVSERSSDQIFDDLRRSSYEEERAVEKDD